MTRKPILPVLGFVLLSATAIPAADEPGVVIWKSDQLKGYTKTMTNLDPLKYQSVPLKDFGRYVTSMSHREGNGDAEIHEKIVDIVVVQSGHATLLLGGKLVKPHSTGPGEFRASSGEGGVKHEIGPGDVVNIPANTLHQFFVPAGGQITYFVIKVRSN